MARDISTRAMPGSLTRTFAPLHLPTLTPLTLSHGDPGEVPVGLLVSNSRVLTSGDLVGSGAQRDDGASLCVELVGGCATISWLHARVAALRRDWDPEGTSRMNAVVGGLQVPKLLNT